MSNDLERFKSCYVGKRVAFKVWRFHTDESTKSGKGWLEPIRGTVLSFIADRRQADRRTKTKKVKQERRHNERRQKSQIVYFVQVQGDDGETRELSIRGVQIISKLTKAEQRILSGLYPRQYVHLDDFLLANCPISATEKREFIARLRFPNDQQKQQELIASDKIAPTTSEFVYLSQLAKVQWGINEVEKLRERLQQAKARSSSKPSKSIRRRNNDEQRAACSNWLENVCQRALSRTDADIVGMFADFVEITFLVDQLRSFGIKDLNLTKSEGLSLANSSPTAERRLENRDRDEQIMRIFHEVRPDSKNLNEAYRKIQKRILPERGKKPLGIKQIGNIVKKLAAEI